MSREPSYKLHGDMAVSNYRSTMPPGEESVLMAVQDQPNQAPPSFLVRTAMRISRARWFTFLRRVFHYQNGSGSDLGPNPFNSSSWMMTEFMALAVQISITTFTLAVSKGEKPASPIRLWLVGYDSGCVLSLMLLCQRYRHLNVAPGEEFTLPDVEQQRVSEDSRNLHLVDKCRTCLELFFAIWFVIGNVWAINSCNGPFARAPKLQVLCISLLAWNAVTYSVPLLLFLLLCCCVPLASCLLGYNMTMCSVDKGASDDQISSLPTWRYKEEYANNFRTRENTDCNSSSAAEDPKCCICLTEYRDEEEVRQLPCSHMFHLNCVDQWLRIISSCPLCKQELQR